MSGVLVESALRSLALGLAVGAGLWITRARGARLQMTAWSLVLAGALLMPFLMRWRAIEIQTPVQLTTAAPVFLRADQPSLHMAAPSEQQATRRADWKTVAKTVYLGTTAVLLLRLSIGMLLTLRLWRSARRVHEPWNGSFDIRETPALPAPATFGSSILLPAEWRDWDGAKLDAVIAHERAHVEWCDFYVLLFARLHLAVFWFSPLAWWLRNRLVVLAEAASDDAALGTVADRPSYAEILLGFASRPQPATEAVAMARMSTVSRRVERILSDYRLPADAGWKQYTLLAACAAALAAVIAGSSVSAQTPAAKPASPQAEKPAKAQAGKKTEPQAGKTSGTWWWQNGSHGDPFAIVSGDSLTMSGSEDSAERARSFRSKIPGTYIWFEHDGKPYLITDAATVKRAQELFAPQEELGRKQAALGTQQAMLGEQQAKLGLRQAGVAVRTPALDDKVRALRAEVQAIDKQLREDKSRELASTDKALAELADELRASKDKEISQEKLASLQAMVAGAQSRIVNDSSGHIAEVQARIAELQASFGEAQARAGEAQAKLGDEQAHLGELQAKLGAEQAALGERQARLAEEASRQLRRMFEEALKGGIARPAE